MKNFLIGLVLLLASAFSYAQQNLVINFPDRTETGGYLAVSDIQECKLYRVESTGREVTVLTATENKQTFMPPLKREEMIYKAYCWDKDGRKSAPAEIKIQYGLKVVK